MARGGYREGAGRPSGSTNKSSPEQSQRLSANPISKHQPPYPLPYV